jgi:hypothetical protein
LAWGWPLWRGPQFSTSRAPVQKVLPRQIPPLQIRRGRHKAAPF